MLDIIIALAVAILLIYTVRRVYQNSKTLAKEQKTHTHYKFNAIKQIMEQIPRRAEFALSVHMHNEFYIDPYKRENLEAVAQEVLAHCEYHGRTPEVRYTLLGNQTSNHTLNANRYYLTIGTDKHPSPDVLLALLIHECMHLYIYENHIGFVGISEEEATYILAIHMGFYEQIVKGVREIGHLSRNEVEEIKNIISLNQ